jgi:hypothetical protein
MAAIIDFFIMVMSPDVKIRDVASKRDAGRRRLEMAALVAAVRTVITSWLKL